MTDPDAWLSYPDAPRILVPPPGPNSRAWLAEQHQLETEAVVYPTHFPIAVREAKGSTVEDVDGNRYIDWVAGVSVLNLGHRHPRLVAALERQAAKIWHALELPTEARLDFLRQLRPVLPGALRDRGRVLFTVTGGDAVETAVNVADYVKGRRGTIVFSGAYHGVHGGAANLTSGRKFRATTSFRGASVVRVPYPDPYRPVLGSGDSAAGVLQYLESLFSDPYSGLDELSSVLVEPILGEGGYVVPPDDFLPGLREFCDRHDLLLIVDEIQSGLGRTGKMWAVDHVGVSPDILCAAKTIGGGLPLSLVAYRPDLGKELPAGFHLGTYRANPLALAVGAETLKVLSDTPAIASAARRGPKVRERLEAIASDHASIGDVRGRGFMIGVEFVKDASTRSPYPERAKAMRRELLERGVLMHTCGSRDNVLRFMAPLVIEDELIDRGLAAFSDALASLDGGTAPTGPKVAVRTPVDARPRPAPAIATFPVPMPSPPPPGRSLP